MDRVDSIRIVTLNRPEKLNAADLAMQQQIAARLDEIGADNEVRAVVLTGAGRSFCAGGDRAVAMAAAEGRLPNPKDFTRVYDRIVRGMLELPIPIIAAVNGGAFGFGADLVALCDLAVIGENGFLSDPHVLFGLPASPVTQLVWPRLISHAVARELLTTGRKVDAAEALRLGLVNRICAPGDELKTALEMARIYAAMPPNGLGATRRALNRPILEAFDGLGLLKDE